jgi:hypothetical protein
MLKLQVTPHSAQRLCSVLHNTAVEARVVEAEAELYCTIAYYRWYYGGDGTEAGTGI